MKTLLFILIIGVLLMTGFRAEDVEWLAKMGQL
jgi:hypothetical protein